MASKFGNIEIRYGHYVAARDAALANLGACLRDAGALWAAAINESRNGLMERYELGRDIERREDDWWDLKDAARAALGALPDALKPFGVFQELEAAIGRGMPGGGESRAAPLRRALVEVTRDLWRIDCHRQEFSTPGLVVRVAREYLGYTDGNVEDFLAALAEEEGGR